MIPMDPGLSDYITRHSCPEDKILAGLNRQTYLDMLNPQMLAGHLQGKTLEMLSRMIRPEVILEIGTFTGYSAICLARGLDKSGHLYTIEINDEQRTIISQHLSNSGLMDRITVLFGDARRLIPEIPVNRFDLVYIDGEKDEYCEYYRLVIDRLKPGGFIIADNVLWGGKVLDEYEPADRSTRGIIRFNEMVIQDQRVENIILPVRDGLSLIRKK
jgi:predicted O-methyltransferase YrrM